MNQAAQVAPRGSAMPVGVNGAFEAEADVVVVGAGGGGFPAALFARWQGEEVLVLEKAPEVGGTAKKAAFWYWVPNNEAMRALGREDAKPDYLRYVARLSRPTRYDPDSPTLGLTDWEYQMVSAIYDSASAAAQALHDRGALVYRHCEAVPDYWAELPENKAPYGRVLCPADASESMADGGEQAIRSFAAAAARDGVEVRTGHRVQRVVLDQGRVVGVEATTPDGALHRIGARKAVIFATGGFTHDDDLRANFLSVPAYRGCAATTNEGDFVRISSAVGGQLRNMNYAWMCPVPLERSGRADLVGMFSVAGDSMVFVNRHGRRVVNEKLPYNELAQVFFTWDGTAGAYPNLVLVQIWDQRSQDHSASTEYGRL
ncbi:MAG TPA: FAD-dependent oxidoreductase, partial [Acidimicrobiales bacterium]|nr:FAD-dependent oxidoreductase [Acidimicrobiales bacterium]